MSGVAILLVVFIVINVILGIARCARRQEQARTAELQRFREERRQQQQGTATSPTTTTTTQPTPTAPTETAEERKQHVKKFLYRRQLEHADSVRTLSVVLAAANDRYEDSNESKFLSRTWRSAASSVRTMMGSAPECSICLDRYQANEVVCWAKNEDCDHIYHEDCILQWLGDHDDCPLCRTNLLVLEEDED